MNADEEFMAARTPKSEATGAGSKSDACDDMQLGPHPSDREQGPPHEVEVAPASGGDAADTEEAVQPWSKVSQRIRTLQLERAELKAKSKAAAKAMRAAPRQAVVRCEPQDACQQAPCEGNALVFSSLCSSSTQSLRKSNRSTDSHDSLTSAMMLRSDRGSPA